MLWAWLRFNCGGNKALHKGHEPTFEDRDAARQEFVLLDDVEDWIVADSHDGSDPLDEPLHI